MRSFLFIITFSVSFVRLEISTTTTFAGGHGQKLTVVTTNRSRETIESKYRFQHKYSNSILDNVQSTSPQNHAVSTPAKYADQGQ